MNTLIETILQQLITNKQTFTAYDVTLALRYQGHWAFNNNVKDIVHTLMLDEAQYNRVSKNFGMNSAWLYFHEDNDPENYDQNLLQSSLKTGNFATQTPAPATPKTFPFTVNSELKIRLSTEFCEELGVCPGHQVKMTAIDSYKVAIEAYDDNGVSSMDERLYTSDQYNNVKIKMDYFFKNVKSGDVVEFELKNNYTAIGTLL